MQPKPVDLSRQILVMCGLNLCDTPEQTHQISFRGGRVLLRFERLQDIQQRQQGPWLPSVCEWQFFDFFRIAQKA
jgi:hypothetical protein